LHEAFLDSTILWAFVGPSRFEHNHDVCVVIFEREDVRRYTSETVSYEVKQSESRRARLYSELIAHHVLKKKPEEFDTSLFSRHVAERARALIRETRGNEADIELLRELSQMEAARIRTARSRIEKPFVPAKKDPYLQDEMRLALSIELGDAKIVTDYVSWAPAHTMAKFLTGDGRLLGALRAGLAKFLVDRMISAPTVHDFLEPDRYLSSLPPFSSTSLRNR